MERKKMGEKVSKVRVLQSTKHIKYCAVENLGRKIPFLIYTGALIPWALFHRLFLLLDF
jgi:hypothetical protein